jgi:hypothetical protein
MMPLATFGGLACYGLGFGDAPAESSHGVLSLRHFRGDIPLHLHPIDCDEVDPFCLREFLGG